MTRLDVCEKCSDCYYDEENVVWFCQANVELFLHRLVEPNMSYREFIDIKNPNFPVPKYCHYALEHLMVDPRATS